jgi:TRAP transporter TAXI family solute receptor
VADQSASAVLAKESLKMRAWVHQAIALASIICITSPAALAQSETSFDLIAQAQVKSAPRTPTAAASGEASLVARANEWTLGLAGGTPSGTFMRFAAEIARNINQVGEARVLAVVTGGATDSLKDLLYLRGIDLAITHADVFEHFKNVEKTPNIEKRVNFISELYVSEIHVLVRPEINSFKDLEGKKVSFHAPGGGSSVTGPIVFRRMGVNVQPVYIDNEIAYEQMKAGEIAGLVFTVGKPNNLFTKNKNDHGFRFLPVPIDDFIDLYLPTKLTADDYPGYVKPGEPVETIGVQAVLAVYNWPRENSDRFRRIVRFIDSYFDHFDKFLTPPYHPSWKTINLAAEVRGWSRYWVVEEKLKQIIAAREAKAQGIDLQLARRQATQAAPRKTEDQERLFQEFLKWTKNKGR